MSAIVAEFGQALARIAGAGRAPLAHVADQVFVELAQEIERQGVGRKVVADKFGMALRTYQKRVQRLSESTSVRGHAPDAVADHLKVNTMSMVAVPGSVFVVATYATRGVGSLLRVVPPQ